MPTAILSALIRHLLTAVGGGLLMTEDEVAAAAGAIYILIGVTWSVIQKRRKTQ